MAARGGPTGGVARNERRRGVALCLAAALACGIQFADSPFSGPEIVPAQAVVDTSAAAVLDTPARGQELKLIWRDFRPGERLVASPAGWICAAALQRGDGHAALVVRLCIEQPVSPQRRYGLGYDAFVLSAALPGGERLSYSLVNFRTTSPRRASEFSEGPTRDNSAPISRVFVRDATDIVVVFESDLPIGTPAILVQGALGGRAFSDNQTFEPLGPASESVLLESLHSERAPLWAKRRP